MTKTETGTTSLEFLLTGPPIIGSERFMAFAGYGSLFVETYSSTGIINHAPSAGANSTVSTFSGVEGGAFFNDVIQFVDGPGMAFIDATTSCTRFKQDEAHGSASIQLGGVSVQMFSSTSFPPVQHLITQFSLTGSLIVRGNVSASAEDPIPYDENQGSSFGHADGGIRIFIVTDASGNVIHPQYYTDSETRYLGDVGFVPEPGTWLLVALGIGLAAARIGSQGSILPE